MALKIKIGKADYDGLDESLKTLYVADGDGYKLDADYEDVTGLKAKNAELLTEIKKQQSAVKAYEGLDPEKARQALAALEKLENEKLVSEGDIEKIKQQLAERHKADLDAANATTQAASERANAIINNLKMEKIKTVGISKGMKPSQIVGAIAEGGFQHIFELDEADFNLRVKDGIGDAKEIDEVFGKFRNEKPDYFLPMDALGSGASGSDGKGTNGGKRLDRAAFAKLAPTEQLAFSQEVNQGKAQLVD